MQRIRVLHRLLIKLVLRKQNVNGAQTCAKQIHAPTMLLNLHVQVMLRASGQQRTLSAQLIHARAATIQLPAVMKALVSGTVKTA